MDFQVPRCTGRTCKAPVCEDASEDICIDAASKTGKPWSCLGAYFCNKVDGAYSVPLGEAYGHNCIASLVNTGFSSHMTVDFYCFGIIDILKYFNSVAKWEYLAKMGFVRHVSVQRPSRYQKRFKDFL